MNKANPPVGSKSALKHRILLWCGCVLVVLGLAALVFDWFVAQPFYRMMEAQRSQVIQRGGTYQFQQLEQKILRYGWHGSDGSWIGIGGGKQWMEVLMQIVERKEPLVCDGGSQSEGLAFISCHAPQLGPNGDYNLEYEYWKTWWQENKDKEQWEWIQAGLAKYGMQVDRPVTPGVIQQILLRIGDHKIYQELQRNENLGNQKVVKGVKRPPEEIEAERVQRSAERKKHFLPYHVLFNAHRWLRDFGGISGLAELPALEDEQQKQWLKAGLHAHERWLKDYSFEIGRLDQKEEYLSQDRDFNNWREGAGEKFTPYLSSVAWGLMVIGTAVASWQMGQRRVLAK